MCGNGNTIAVMFDNNFTSLGRAFHSQVLKQREFGIIYIQKHPFLVGFRYDWYQTETHVIVTIMLKNVQKEDLSVNVDDTNVCIIHTKKLKKKSLKSSSYQKKDGCICYLTLPSLDQDVRDELY